MGAKFEKMAGFYEVVAVSAHREVLVRATVATGSLVPFVSLSSLYPHDDPSITLARKAMIWNVAAGA